MRYKNKTKLGLHLETQRNTGEWFQIKGRTDMTTEHNIAPGIFFCHKGHVWTTGKI